MLTLGRRKRRLCKKPLGLAVHHHADMLHLLRNQVSNEWTLCNVMPALQTCTSCQGFAAHHSQGSQTHTCVTAPRLLRSISLSHGSQALHQQQHVRVDRLTVTETYTPSVPHQMLGSAAGTTQPKAVGQHHMEAAGSAQLLTSARGRSAPALMAVGSQRCAQRCRRPRLHCRASPRPASSQPPATCDICQHTFSCTPRL
jgi:hypothetical protein